MRSTGPALLALPVILGLVALAPALGGDFTNWDDPTYLTLNPQTEDPLRDGALGLLLTESIGYPIPVTITGYAAQRAAFGLEPAGFHAVSLLLHALVVALAAALARRLGTSRLAAALAASVFAVHPLTVEPVAWVVGQKDLLAAAFLLGALAIRAGPRGDAPGRSAGVALLLVLSLLSKPNTVGAPLLIAGVDWALSRRLTTPRNLALYAAAAAAAAAVTILALIGHEGAPVDAFGGESLAHAGWALGLQARHVVAPWPLLARYFPPETLWPGIALGVAATLALTAAAAISWRRGHRAVAFGIAAAVIAYAPVSGILPMTRGTADSYLYLPLALAATAGAHALEAAVSRARWVTLAAVAGVLCAGVAGSWQQTGTWASATALWTPVAEHHPDEPRALMRLADARVFDGSPSEALAIHEHIRRRFPEFPNSTFGHARILEMLQRPGEAEAILAIGARVGTDPIYREEYAFFLVRWRVPPSDRELARTSLMQIAPLLAERGKKPSSLHRGAELLDELGEPEAAASLRERLAELQRRRR